MSQAMAPSCGARQGRAVAANAAPRRINSRNLRSRDFGSEGRRKDWRCPHNTTRSDERDVQKKRMQHSPTSAVIRASAE